jgi:acetyltransferase-like isoleucine patch superfamily enzyme
VPSPKPRRPMDDPLNLVPRGLTKLYSLWLSKTYPFASIGTNVSFHYTSRVCRSRATRIRIGNSCSLREYAWLNVATEEYPGEPTIILEDNCHVGFGSIISGYNRVHLERNVLIGQMVIIVDHNHSYEEISTPIVDQGVSGNGTIHIGEGTWIGHGAAIISPRSELTIGRNCVIAANSVVMRSIPDYCVAAGYPATIIRRYDPQTRSWRIGRSDLKTAPEPEVDPQLSVAGRA